MVLTFFSLFSSHVTYTISRKLGIHFILFWHIFHPFRSLQSTRDYIYNIRQLSSVVEKSATKFGGTDKKWQTRD